MKLSILLILISFSQFSFAVRGDVSLEQNIIQKLGQSIFSIQKMRKGKLQHVCTGSLIAKNIILTAAHCFDDKIFEVKVQYAGSFYKVKKVKVHKGYKREDIYDPYWGYLYDIKIQNDIALLVLDKDANLPIVKLASTKKLDLKSRLFIAGLGQTANIFGMGEGEGVLRVSKETYVTTLEPERIIIEDNITGSCQGDSGGPLFMEDANGSYLQIAITSQGDCNIVSHFERVNWSKLNSSKYFVY